MIALSTMCVRAQEKGGKAFGFGEYALARAKERLTRDFRSPEEYFHPDL